LQPIRNVSNEDDPRSVFGKKEGMMIRRLILAIVLVASTAAVALAYPATLLLKTGERISGELSYKLGGNDVTVNGHDYSLDNVAVIAYVPNDPTPTEVSRVPSMDGNPSELERHVFVTRDGQLIFGKLYKFSSDGRIVTFDDRGGSRRDIPADQLARIYINPGSARRVYAPILAALNPPPNAAGTPGSISGPRVRVPGNQQWVATGINVTRGETIRFDSTGEVMWTREQADRATPAGALNGRRPGNPPVAGAPGGALIARIGPASAFNSGRRPFFVGNQQAVVMPASGPLFLGINDEVFTDNTGDFFVTVGR
jgi:hypothetical protein